MKTLAQWNASRKNLDKFLEVGDAVDAAFVEWALGVVPPATMKHHLVQIGEACSHINGRATYSTFKWNGAEWIYCGDCHKGETELPVGV